MFPLISGWLRTFKAALTFALAHEDQYDARCQTCNPETCRLAGGPLRLVLSYSALVAIYVEMNE